MVFFMDDSIDVFGFVITAASFVCGASFMKPEWPMWMTSLGSVAVLLGITWLLPGRRLRKAKDA